MKFKNSYLSLLALLGFTLSNAMAGTDVGNGGGAWVCQNLDQLRTIRWAKVVDLYEAHAEFGLKIPSRNQDYATIVDWVLKERLASLDRDFAQGVAEQVDKVRQNLVFTDGDLQIVEDALYRVRPSEKECLNGKISYVQVANFTNYGKILLQRNIFEDPRLGETGRAAIIIHEAVYAFLRAQYDDPNSVRARKIVGLIFSDLKQDVLRKEIDRLIRLLVVDFGISLPVMEQNGKVIRDDFMRRLSFTINEKLDKFGAQERAAKMCKKYEEWVNFGRSHIVPTATDMAVYVMLLARDENSEWIPVDQSIISRKETPFDRPLAPFNSVGDCVSALEQSIYELSQQLQVKN